MAPWLLVTPSSRGIGLALTRHLLKTTDPSVPLVATARSKDVDSVRQQMLDGLFEKNEGEQRELAAKRLDVRGGVDFDDESTIEDTALYCKDRYNNRDKDKDAHLRLGFLIPGILYPERTPEAISAPDALQTLRTNLLAPLLLTKHFSPLLPTKTTKISSTPSLPATATLALMSARVGSISDNALGGWYSYRASKAGVNQLAKTLDIHLRRISGGKAMAVALHPGTVKTGLSQEFWGNVKEGKLFEPAFAAERLCSVVGELAGRAEKGDKGVGGRCWDWKGDEVPP